MRNLQEQVKKAFCYHKFSCPSTVWINCKVPILQVALLFQMQLWPVTHFFHSQLGGFAVALLFTHPEVSEKSGQLVRVAFGKEVLPRSEWKKWATGQSCIRKRSTTWKIGTLALISMKPKFEHYLFTTKFFRKLWNHIWIWNPCIIKS